VKTISTIALKEFRDRLSSGWVIVCVLIWLAAILLTSFFGLIQIGRIGAQGYERTTASLLNLAQYLAPLLGLLIGHDVIVREREDRTLHLIIASGVSRTVLAVGKFCGAALTLVVPLIAGFVIAGTLVGVAARDASFALFLKLSISTIAIGIIFGAIGTAVSVFARSRIHALVFILLVWGVAVFAFDLVALGVKRFQQSAARFQRNRDDLRCDAHQ
jgi:Cu-processing system permease protein